MKLLYQHAPALPLTSAWVAFPRTGVCLDPPALRGVSRLMGRLLFMGAGGLSSRELNGRLERLGATMGCSLANDVVTLRLETVTENLDEALELFLLSIREPDFSEVEFERVRAELLGAWSAEREEHKQLRAQEMYIQQIYRGAPNGYLPDGTARGLAACTVADVRAQYARLFAGSEAPFLAVMSDLPEDAVGARIVPRVSAVALAHNPAGGAYPWDGFAPAPAAGRRITIIPEPGNNTDELILGAFCAREKDPDWHIHKLIAFIFGGDMNSRLFRILRGEHGFSYGASCWYETAMGRCPRDQLSPFSMYTFPAVEFTAEALPLLLSLYEELVERGVSEEELALARRALVNSHPFMRDTPGKLLALRMAKALYGVDTDDEAANRERMEAVGAQDVLRVLRGTHHPERLEMILLGDPARLEPLAERVPGVAELEVIPYPEPPQEGQG